MIRFILCYLIFLLPTGNLFSQTKPKIIDGKIGISKWDRSELKLKGTIELLYEVGKGSEFIIKIPA